jgi:hypothetical protein
MSALPEFVAHYRQGAIAAFTPASFGPGTGAQPPGPVPVFIVGMPRSGTTLCEQIIAAHPQAHGMSAAPHTP